MSVSADRVRTFVGLAAFAVAACGTAQTPPAVITDKAIEFARHFGASEPFEVREAELVIPGRTKLPRTWSLSFDHCRVSVVEPSGRLQMYRRGGLLGRDGSYELSDQIPKGAAAKFFSTRREQEAELRKIARGLGLDLESWEFEDISVRTPRQPLFKTFRLRQPSFGYPGETSFLRLGLDQYHGVILEAFYSAGWTVTPPPDSMVSPEDAVLLAKAAVERKSAENQALGGTALEWPGDAQAMARSRLWYERLAVNDWMSDEMRAHLGKKVLRLARSYSHADWFVLLDAETGHVLGGGQTIGYSPRAGRAGGPPGAERSPGPPPPPAGVMVAAAVCALAGAGAWIAVRRRAR